MGQPPVSAAIRRVTYFRCFLFHLQQFLSSPFRTPSIPERGAFSKHYGYSAHLMHNIRYEAPILRQSSRRVWLMLRRPEARLDRAAQSSLPDKRIGSPLSSGRLRTVRPEHRLDGSCGDLLPLLWEAASIERRHPDQIGSGSEHPTVRSQVNSRVGCHTRLPVQDICRASFSERKVL